MKSTSFNLNEPSCEQLRQMWQFSRRQSRASEITNEIPTYHDPFSMNVWDPYYPTATRSLGGRRINSRYRYPGGRPVYGRVVHQPTQQIAIGGRYYDVSAPLERGRPNYDDFMNIKPFSGPENLLMGGQQQQQQAKNNRKQAKVRFAGSGNVMPGSNSITGSPGMQHAIFGSTGINQIAPQRGSFQRLKELVWTERARELSQQRKSEEVAARAAILKEITNGQHYKTSMSSPSSSRRAKSGGLNSNKNKLLKNESKGLNNKGDMQQLMSRSSSSSYWSPNENVKRSPQQQQQQRTEMAGTNSINNIYPSSPDENDFLFKDYLVGGGGGGGGGGVLAAADGPEDVTYFEDEDEDGGLDYGVNGFFNSINEDNINDFYFYINQLLSKKPNQKSI